MLNAQLLGRQPCPCTILQSQRCPQATSPSTLQQSSSSRTALRPTAYRIHPQAESQRLQLTAAAAAAATASVTLSSLELSALVNLQGFILPTVPANTEATVFGIYDQNKNLQYVGFSKDYRNTLRTLLGRRPDKAWFHRAQHLEKLDQAQMMTIRDAWFEQSKGGTPPGNKMPTERNAWQKPLAAIAISVRGRLQAAQTLAQEQLLLLKGRGVREDFAINPALLQEGLVDFLPSKAMTAEEIAQQQSLFESLAKATRSITVEVDGEPLEVQIFFKAAFRTNGGHMFDVSVTYDDKETEHRIIVGRDYYEFQGLSPEEVVERVLAFLTRKKVPRHTEGVLLCSQFPINYFSITTVEQWFEEEFLTAFSDSDYILPGQNKFWRFNKIHAYGSRNFGLDVDQGLLVPAGEA